MINRHDKYKTFNLVKGAFTLIEIIISTFISVIIFSVIFVFAFNMLDNITESRLNISMYSNFDDFYDKLYSYNYTYSSGTILSSLTGSNVMIMNDLNQNKGILFGLVNIDTLKLDIDETIYKNTVIGFRKLSSLEITNILADNNNALNLSFQKDNLYTNLIIKDLKITSYNTGYINNYEMSINTYYKSSLKGKLWSELPLDDVLKINFTF